MAIELRRIKIGDASDLRFMNLMAGTLGRIENEIRSFMNSPAVEVLVVLKDEVISSMVKLYLMDRKNCRVHTEFVFTDDAFFTGDDYRELINAILKYCFITRQFHKITVTISSKNRYLEPFVAESGFIQEAILRDEIRVGNTFEDAGLFAILSSEYKEYNVCFVPFTYGVIMISGGMDFIDGVKIYHYGDVLEGSFERDVGSSLGVVDEEFRFIEDEELYAQDESALETYPDELARAYVQLREYLTKKRERFDLNFVFPNATDFQRKVWGVIRTIPYGGNMSYEDIALKLTGDNISEARKITRAVGSACGENPILIMIPCHRVISKDNKLLGYSAGADIKDYLLMLESFSIIGGRKNGEA